MAELEAELAESDLGDVIPRKKLQKLLLKADVDRNSYITYAEFMNMV
jgi:Ca2+-binding EF-hand superfamily protein